MYTLNFPDGRTQTYPDQSTLYAAAKAMGGETRCVNSNAHIYVFIPKK